MTETLDKDLKLNTEEEKTITQLDEKPKG